MKNFKAIFRFVSIFAITYIFFLLPQIGFDRKYEEIFRKLGNDIYNGKNQEEVIFLKEVQTKEYDTKLYLSKKSLRDKNNDYKGTIFPMKVRRIGFIATSFLISLIIATPLTWRRKFLALLFGIIGMLFFAMIKLRVIMLHFYTQSKWVGLHQEPEEVKRIEFWNEIFGRSNTNSYYVAIILWFILCFGKSEWQKLNGTFSTLVAKPIKKNDIKIRPAETKKSSIKNKK